MNNIIYETSCQSGFDARYWMLGAGAPGRPRGMVWGGRREEGLGGGTRVYLWQILIDIWQNQYSIVKLKNKIKFKKRRAWNDWPNYEKKKVTLRKKTESKSFLNPNILKLTVNEFARQTTSQISVYLEKFSLYGYDINVQ